MILEFDCCTGAAKQKRGGLKEHKNTKLGLILKNFHKFYQVLKASLSRDVGLTQNA